MKTNKNALTDLFTVLITAGLILSSCAPGPTAVPAISTTNTTYPTRTPVPTPALTLPTRTPVPIPALTLKPGDFYFSIDGQPSFILSRNITGNTGDDFSTLLEWAHQGGTRVLRIHIITGWAVPWINKDWSVNGQWLQDWDMFFDQAQADGIFIIPVFGVWADWNDVLPADVFHFWQYNPLNAVNGGPLTSPTGLFQSGSDTQQHWMAWVQTLVAHWQGRQNIAAWEIFSEINLASGAPGLTDSAGAVSETAAVDFTNTAAAIIRAADTQHRPVTISLAVGAPFTSEWGEFYENNTLDFIEIHPYSDQLDRELVSDVQNNIIRYHKPVLIGESGLWSAGHNANASIGIEHAIWAGLVSGAMNGRALWDNDGYALYSSLSHTDAIQFMQSYATAELPVARFVNGMDFSGFQPLQSTSTSGIWGAAVGDEKSVIGWFRDATCEPPDWSLKPVLSNQTVTITVPGSSANWEVDFYNTRTGTDIISSATVIRAGSSITVNLPDFQDDIAFKMTALEGPESSITPSPSTDAIAGQWTGTISSTDGTFSTLLNLDIQAGCNPGQLCGTYSTPQVSCSGKLFLQGVTGQTFLFIEQDATGPIYCTSGGQETLQLLADGTLSYQFSAPGASDYTTAGILHRP